MSQSPDWRHSLQFSAEPASASLARAFVSSRLLRAGVPQLEDDVLLVVSELVTNAITHARTPVTVTLERSGPCVVLTVCDLSPSVPVMRTADAMAGGGRGLMIVDVLSGDWGVKVSPSGSKTVWAAFEVQDDVVAVS
jgi:anti-sigma regulatory factor (Ser/Thr protein kinase)